VSSGILAAAHLCVGSVKILKNNGENISRMTQWTQHEAFEYDTSSIVANQ
jgi:hypothetical protein